MSTITRNLSSLTLGAVIALSGAACDAGDVESMGEGSSMRAGGGWSGLTINTHAWVSPAARDIYEFDRTGAWYTNGYDYEVQLTKIKFQHPQLGAGRGHRRAELGHVARVIDAHTQPRPRGSRQDPLGPEEASGDEPGHSRGEQ